MKIYSQVLTFFVKPQIWLFHVVVLQTTAKKWTKVENARAGRAKLLFLFIKYANLLLSANSARHFKRALIRGPWALRFPPLGLPLSSAFCN